MICLARPDDKHGYMAITMWTVTMTRLNSTPRRGAWSEQGPNETCIRPSNTMGTDSLWGQSGSLARQHVEWIIDRQAYQ